jgi:glycosyltransferase involved in cell wall biosynthesis
MRVMHVVAPAPVGGLEQVLVALAGGQQAAGHSVSVAAVVAAGEQEPAVVARLKSLGIDVHVIASQPRAYWSQVSAIRSLHERLAPDTIHTHGYHPDVLGAVLKRFASRATLVSTAHGFSRGPLRNRVYERLQLHALRRFDAVVAVSRKLAAELKAGGCQPSRVRVLPNAWSPIDPPLAKTDARQTLGIPIEIFSVGWVGRVSYEKGLDVLVRALSLVTEIPLRLTVIGDGPERAVAQNLAKTLGVDARIAWPGRVPDAARLLRAFDVLVISSRTEGTPMTLLEAMSASVAILTTAVGGIPDVVSQDDAILVSPEDPAAIADGLRALYADPEAAAVRAERARARVESAYAVQPWVEAYDLVYSAARTVADAK